MGPQKAYDNNNQWYQSQKWPNIIGSLAAMKTSLAFKGQFINYNAKS